MPCLKKFTTRGVYIHTVCLAHTHSAHACTYLNNFWTSTSVLPFLVGVACAFGLVVHVQWKCEPKIQESKKMAERSLKEFKIYGYGYGYVSRQSCAFFASLNTAPLYRTHQPCHRLHSVVAALHCNPVFTFIFMAVSFFFLTPVTIFWQWDH